MSKTIGVLRLNFPPEKLAGQPLFSNGIFGSRGATVLELQGNVRNFGKCSRRRRQNLTLPPPDFRKPDPHPNPARPTEQRLDRTSFFCELVVRYLCPRFVGGGDEYGVTIPSSLPSPPWRRRMRSSVLAMANVWFAGFGGFRAAGQCQEF